MGSPENSITQTGTDAASPGIPFEPYVHEKHYKLLCGWLWAKGIPAPNPQFFPVYGFIVDGCAIGFLVRTDSKQSYMDYVAADPDVAQRKRDEALNFLFRHVQEEARKQGFFGMTALADLPAMQVRLARHGFNKVRDFSLYFKFLGGKTCLS